MVKPVELSHCNSSIAPSSMKRKKTDDDDSSSSAAKKRTRVSYSCGECHRRKQKCDRQVPCSHCVARKVPELCKAYTPGKPDQDIHLRLARLEHIIEVALPQYASGSRSMSVDPFGTEHQRSVSPSAEGAHNSQADDEDPSGGTFQSGKWYGNSASGSVAGASVLEQLQNVVPAADGAGGSGIRNDRRSGDSAYASPTMREDATAHHVSENAIIDSVRLDSEPTAADNLKTLVQDCGVSPHKITELVQELPPQRFSDVLVDYYFSAVNWTRYPISESDFRQSYASVCANGVSAHPNDVRFLPLLFVVLAIAVRLAPEHIAGDARSRRLTSLRYHWSSRRSVLIAAAIQQDSLDMVLTRLLSARFLTFDRRITECWSQLGAAVRTAQALGLHRDGASMRMDPAQVEYRRRVWAYLYHADRSYALVLGRPNAIQDDYTSTLPPLNVEDEVTLAEISNPPPLTTPTRMTHVILRHTLASIVGRIVHHFQKVRQPSHYSEVLVIDDDLLKLMQSLPPVFSMQPDTSLDGTLTYIPAHRFLLLTEILFVRTSLHRPYLLRRLGSDRYARSRRACFESAIKDFEIRSTFRKLMTGETLQPLNIPYREFQSTMVGGIYLVLEPNGPLAERMHTILDTFLKDHEGVREMDETTRREIKIVEFFKMKSRQMEKTVGSAVRQEAPDGPEASLSSSKDAKLLLSMQQSTPSVPRALPIAPSQPFPSLALNPSTSQELGFDAKSSGSFLTSPTVQRLQHYDVSDNQNLSSKSGSPGQEDDSTAQSLLDNWYSTVSSGAVTNGAGVDGSAGLAGLPWGGFGSADLSGWFGSARSSSSMNSHELNCLAASDGSDWSYWETLVNEIRSGPAV